MKTKIVAVIENLAQAKQAKQFSPDILELRVDLLKKTSQTPKRLISLIKSIKKTARLPLIGTIRIKSEGGEFSRNENQRLDLFSQIIPFVDYVDIEINSKIIVKVANLVKKNRKKVIVSYHNFSNTPDVSKLKKLLNKAKKNHPDIIKICTYLRKTNDLVRVINFTKKHTHAKKIPKIAFIPMGKEWYSFCGRILCPMFGSSLTYGFVKKAVAPGQISLPDLTHILGSGLPKEERPFREENSV